MKILLIDYFHPSIISKAVWTIPARSMETSLEKTAREFLRRKDVIALTKIPNATLYELIKQEKFPRQIKLGARLAVWDAQEIADWQEARMAERTTKTVH